MKLTDVGSADHEVEPYLTDDRWVMQQKFDGARVMMVYDEADDSFLWGDGTTPIKFSAALLKLPALEAEMRRLLPMIQALRGHDGRVIFDGELIIESGEYHVFDVLSVYPDSPLRTRLSMLDHLYDCYDRQLVQVVETYRGEDAKRRFWAQVNGAGVEGAVSKHLDSTYEPGKRSTQWLKHKLVKSCECLVLEASREFKPNSQVVKMGSATLGVFDASGTLIRIASASLIGKELTIEPGSVVEVNYLYRQEGGALVQPRIVRQRHDRTAADCVESQIPAYSREAVRA
jgi:ATP-dependent DNA ligase